MNIRFITLLLVFFIFSVGKAQSPINIYMSNTDMECGKSCPINIRVKNFKNVTNFQFSINFPTTRLKGDSVVNYNAAFPDNAYNVLTMPNGDVTFSWSGSPVNLPDDAVLFTMYLTPYFYGLNPPTPGTAAVNFSNSPTPTQAYTTASTMVTYPVTSNSAVVTIVDKTTPTALCPNSQFYKGVDSVLVASITGFAIDDCGSAKITSFKMTGANNITGSSDANGKYYKLGVTKVIYTATDLAGNTAQCPFKIILVKNTDDTITIFANSKLSKCELPGIVEYPVFIANANGKDLDKLNFSLEWSKGNYSFVGITQVNSNISSTTFNTSATTNGQLGVTWSGSGLNLPDNTRLFNLRLKPIGVASQTAVVVMGTPTPVAVSSPTNSNYPVRTEAGELFIVDEIAPVLTCKDTILYSGNTNGSITVPASTIYPNLVENCLLEQDKIQLAGATTLAQTNYVATQNVTLNYGTTTASFFVKDYGANSDQCSSNIKVNRLRFSLNKDSLPCATTSKTLDLRTIDFERLKDFKFTVTWNPSMLNLNQSAIVYPNTTIKNNIVVTGNVAVGTLTFTWTLPSGSLTLPANDIMMSLPFTLIGNVNSPVTINYQSATLENTTFVIPAGITNGSIKNYDTQAPTISNCPSDITFIIPTQGTCSKKITWTPPTFSDNCGAVLASNVKVYKQLGTTFPPKTPTFSGDDFGLGQNVITYEVSDIFGNISTCSFKVNITEKAAPEIVSCVQDIAQNTEPGKNGATVTYGPVTVNESCGIQSETYSKPTNSYFVVGKQSVVYTVTDKSGNLTTCVFNVTISDKEKPKFDDPTFPSNITTTTKIDTCGAFVTWTPPTAKDNYTPSNQIVISSNYTSGSFFPTGTTIVTYTAIDSAGNVTTRNFEITVIDNQAPKFVNCPSAITVNVAGAACNSPYTPPTLKTKDNCIGLVDVTASNIPIGNIFPIGTTKLIYIDPNNASVKCNVDLIIQVGDKPTFSNVNDISVTTDPNECTGTVPSVAEPTAQDACGKNTVTITKSPNLVKYPIGTTIVTYTATDSYGNTSTTSIKIVVKDVNSPTISNCPADITVLADAGKDSKVVSWIPPTANALCSKPVTLTPSNQPGTAFVIGITPVIYTATDAAGNTTTCSFNVKVIDQQPPIIACPPTNNITVDADTLACGKIVPLPGFTDNSGKVPNITASTGIPANNFYPVGKTLVSFTVADESGNTASCSFTVNVKDITKPTFTNVKDVTMNASATDCSGKLATIDTPIASDACGNTTIVVTTNLDTDKLPIGTSIVVYTATDSDGNKVTTTIKVTIIDNIAPTFTACPSNISVSTDLGKDFATVTWTPPTAQDNCPVTVTSTSKPNDLFNIGTKLVTYTATDASGNTVTCTFEVVVTDQEKPTIDCKDITINNKAGECGAALVSLPKVTDNVNVVSTTFNPALPTNNYFNIGTSTFTITAADAAGNIANCTLNVIVKDSEKPIATTCPKDVTIDAVKGECSVTLPSLPKPTFTDNCNVNDLVITSNRDSLAKPLEFKTGTITQVVFYAKDKDGQIGKCIYNVIVNGDIKPIVTCPSDINVVLSVNKCDTTISWSPATAIPVCSPLVGSVQVDVVSGSVFKAGTSTPVTYKIKDQSGLEGVCVFNINVKESSLPTFTGTFPSDVELTADVNDCTATTTWSIPTASDNCTATADIKIEQLTGPKSGDKLNVGVYTVTYRITDKSGNTKDKSFVITVKDKVNPAFTICPKDVTVDLFGNIVSDPDKQIATISKSVDCKSVALTFNNLTATDKCSTPVTITNNGIKDFTVGVPTEYKYVATDASGNTATCAFKVLVEEFVAPKVDITTTTTTTGSTMSCPGADVQLKAGLVAGATYEWTGPNGFTSTAQNLEIKNVTATNAGNYVLKVTKGTCISTTVATAKVEVMSAPKAVEDKYTVYTGDLLEDSVFPNDTLVAGESTLVKVVEDVTNGKLNLRDDGKFEYTSVKKFIGEDKFKYNVCYEVCPTACSGSTLAKIQVNAKQVKIPNVITPNDDGQNDILVIDYPFNGTEISELYIYNEWGHLIYSVVPYTNASAWKGTYQDKPVPDGTYFYVFKADVDVPVVKGFVTLLR